ncbi:MAG: cysteine desulfurase [Patescibacteria group bacterium]
MFNVQKIKRDFPALRAGGVYLDNAATTQMPEVVWESMQAYLVAGRGNPHRGLHAWAERASGALQESRRQVAALLGAEPDELLFTKSATEGLNLLATSLAAHLGPGDEVLLSIFEHHANLLPWRELAKRQGFSLRYMPMAQDGSVDLDLVKGMVTAATKVISITYASNVLGVILPVAEITRLGHAVGALVIVDAAQVVGHVPVDVKILGCDALVFGAHKMYGPDGVGAVYVNGNLRKMLKPFLYGGGMVTEVLDDEIHYADDLRLFEAGSPNVTGAIGLAAACKYLMSLGLAEIQQHEAGLTQELMARLVEVPEVKVYVPNPKFGRLGVVSMSLEGVHSHDLAQVLADQGIAVRAGYHCAAPLTRCLNVSGTVRVSLGVYNDLADIEQLVTGIETGLKRLV